MKRMQVALAFVSGVATTLIVMLGLGAAAAADGPVGRFQIHMNERHVFILDTVTGRVWRDHMSPDIGSISENFSGSKLNEIKGPQN